MKILIVDDNIDVAETIQAVLENCESTLAYSWKEASEILAKQTFDLVITDINMPSGGGERVLSEASAKNIPTFVYTSSDKPDAYYQGLGAKAVFIKPDGIIGIIEAVPHSNNLFSTQFRIIIVRRATASVFNTFMSLPWVIRFPSIILQTLMSE